MSDSKAWAMDNLEFPDYVSPAKAMDAAKKVHRHTEAEKLRMMDEMMKPTMDIPLTDHLKNIDSRMKDLLDIVEQQQRRLDAQQMEIDELRETAI